MAGFVQVRAEQEMSEAQAPGAGEDHVGPSRPVGLNRGQFAPGDMWQCPWSISGCHSWGLSVPI